MRHHTAYLVSILRRRKWGVRQARHNRSAPPHAPVSFRAIDPHRATAFSLAVRPYCRRAAGLQAFTNQNARPGVVHLKVKDRCTSTRQGHRIASSVPWRGRQGASRTYSGRSDTAAAPLRRQDLDLYAGKGCGKLRASLRRQPARWRGPQRWRRWLRSWSGRGRRC